MTNFARRHGLPEQLEDLERRLYELERAIGGDVTGEVAATNGAYNGSARVVERGGQVQVIGVFERPSGNNASFHTVVAGLVEMDLLPATQMEAFGNSHPFHNSSQFYRYRVNTSNGDLEIQETGAVSQFMPVFLTWLIPE